MARARRPAPTGPNQPPVMGPLNDHPSEHPNRMVSFQAEATDPDGDPLTYNLVYPYPSGASIDMNTGQFTWTPTWGQLGAHTITVRARDPQGLDCQGACTITVGNAGPSMQPISDRTGHPHQMVSFQVQATDPEGDPLSYSLVYPYPGGASVDPSTGQFTWTPNWGHVGAHTITVRATDPGGLYCQGACTITVENTGPTLQPLSDQTGHPNQMVWFQSQASDPEGDPVTYNLVSPYPGGAFIDVNTGQFTWTPGTGQIGAHTITVRASDPGGLYDQKACTITISP